MQHGACGVDGIAITTGELITRSAPNVDTFIKQYMAILINLAKNAQCVKAK